MKNYTIFLFIIALILIIGAVYISRKEAIAPTSPAPVACTEEAKICPDGSAVGRQGPNCEFAPCPVAQAVDEMADWKTYTNDKYGFELKYPSDWKYFEQGDAEKLNLPTRENGVLFMSTFTVRFGKDPLNGEFSEVSVFKNATFDDVINMGGNQYLKDTEIPFSVPGALEAIKFHIKMRADLASEYDPKGIGQDIYLILTSCNNINTVYKIVDSQLVNSFRLTKKCGN